MKVFPLPLRFSVPIIIVFFGTILAVFTFQNEMSQSHQDLEARFISHAREDVSGTAAIVEYFYRSDQKLTDTLFTYLTADPNLALALLLDENDKTILTVHHVLSQTHTGDLNISNKSLMFKRIRETMTGSVRLSEDRQAVIAVYPVSFGPMPGKLRPAKIGMLVVAYDLSGWKNQIYIGTINRILPLSAVVLFLCISLWFFFNTFLFRRVISLIKSADRFSQGELGVRTNLGGSDELAKLSEAFNKMADRLQADTEARKNAEDENLKLLAQMLHGQKLESLGVLAGGIAHDFNNLLMSIMGYTELTLKKLPEASQARESVEKIGGLVQRATELTKQMLAYSGKGKFVIENVDLSDLVENMTELLKVSINKNAILNLKLARDLPQIEADATQIRQVVMNLIINASDAIGNKPGVIVVTTGIIEYNRAYLSETEIGKDLPEGTYIYLDVSDTGCGMEEETKAKIFDPFYTTKFTGRGLGLAAVSGIIRGHKGALKVYTKVGKGTTFRVLLPKADRHVEALPADTKEVKDLKNSGKVLIIDDEEEIVSVTKMMLESNGFSVLTATDGQKGVDLFSRHARIITAVVLDLTMPHMNGEEALRKMKNIRSDVRVILSSGYNEEENSRRFSDKGFAGFLQKPYSMKNLLEKILEVTA